MTSEETQGCGHLLVLVSLNLVYSCAAALVQYVREKAKSANLMATMVVLGASSTFPLGVRYAV